MSPNQRRVIFHAGLHKTGTSSLQVALNQTEGCSFPFAGEPSPGHARLIWRALGIHGEERDPEILVLTVRELCQAPSSLPLVLSAEDSVFALSSPDGAEPFRLLAAWTPTELVLTVRPDDERLESFAQEMIKQGRSVDLSRYWEPALESTPMRAGVIRALIDLAPWSRVHIIRTYQQEPLVAFRAFSEILGSEVPEVPSANVRIPAGALAVVNAINRFLESDADHDPELRDRGAVMSLADGIWREVSALDPNLRALPYPSVPPSVLEPLRRRWYRELSDLVSEDRCDLFIYPEKFRRELTEGVIDIAAER